LRSPEVSSVAGGSFMNCCSDQKVSRIGGECLGAPDEVLAASWQWKRIPDDSHVSDALGSDISLRRPQIRRGSPRKTLGAMLDLKPR